MASNDIIPLQNTPDKPLLSSNISKKTDGLSKDSVFEQNELLKEKKRVLENEIRNLKNKELQQQKSMLSKSDLIDFKKLETTPEVLIEEIIRKNNELEEQQNQYAVLLSEINTTVKSNFEKTKIDSFIPQRNFNRNVSAKSGLPSETKVQNIYSSPPVGDLKYSSTVYNPFKSSSIIISNDLRTSNSPVLTNLEQPVSYLNYKKGNYLENPERSIYQNRYLEQPKRVSEYKSSLKKPTTI